MKVINIFRFNRIDRCSMTVVVEDECPWAGDTLVRTRDGAEAIIHGVEQFAKFDKERRTPPGMMIGIVVDVDDVFLPGDEFTVRYAQEPPTVTSRQRAFDMFEQLANDPSEGANDS